MMRDETLEPLRGTGESWKVLERDIRRNWDLEALILGYVRSVGYPAKLRTYISNLEEMLIEQEKIRVDFNDMEDCRVVISV